MNTFKYIIPAPAELFCDEATVLSIEKISSFYLDEKFADFTSVVKDLFSFFSYNVTESKSAGDAVLTITQAALPPEAFIIEITPSNVKIESAAAPGVFYALECLRQMLFAAAISSPQGAVLTCGTVKDTPRFAFRSFHLDSARHFQNIKVIKRMLRLMATFRLNTFHWHLVDKQGWRLQLKTTAGLENCYTNTPGFYT
ncbi:MAG: family 20 glycosylhydrolase, partial [Lentisphaeria bacterium]|nr:family 20 glycosylhydrolase [Lentisphaeria bacterium]